MDNKSVKLDIVIVNYNSTDLLLGCLESFNGSFKTIPANIFIQDNNSKDNFHRIKEQFPNINIQRNKSNIGFSKAINNGIAKGNAPYVLILNPDTQFTNTRFKDTINYMDQSPDIGIIGPKILNMDKSVQGSARAFPSFSTAFFGRNTLLTKLFPNNPISKKNILNTASQSNQVLNVDWVSGACMLIRRKALEEIGTMDERFFMYFEDTDLCRRMWLKNWKVIYHPAFNIQHLVGGSSSQTIFKSVYIFHKSIYLYCSKYSNPRLFLIMKYFILFTLLLRCSSVLSLHALKKTITFLVKKITPASLKYNQT
ncbi:MAG: glycosyltransferase family 2 protein [Desulfobacteraceae bacterium]|nr:glycosyltransferase family 2 protein [Desulfobacteraceae bacterium]